MDIIRQNGYLYTNGHIQFKNKKFLNYLKEMKKQTILPKQILYAIFFTSLSYKNGCYITFTIEQLNNILGNIQFNFLVFWIKKKFPNFVLRLSMNNIDEYQQWVDQYDINKKYIIKFNKQQTVEQISEKIYNFLKCIFVQGYRNEIVY